VSKTAELGGYTYTYTTFHVAELNQGSYVVSYKDANGTTIKASTINVDISAITLTPGDTSQVTAATTNGGTVVVVNSEKFELPYTGGIGTQLFTFSGAVLLFAASLMYILIRHKRRRQCKRGES
jgi:LPXTG-motif cell wall-anchored protein